MSREIRTEEDARKWLEDAEGMKGNQCVTESQARALSDWLDGLQDLINVHEIHPLYVIGALETAKLGVYEYAQECVSKALDMAGMGD